jgi:hypothetical protein
MKCFKKPIQVRFKFITDDVVVKTLEGPVSAGLGHVLLTGVRGEQWPVPIATFNRRYTYEGFEGIAIPKTIMVDADVLTARAEVKVSWSDDVLVGQVGDYLMTYDDGTNGIVEKTIFEETYDCSKP